MFTLLMTARRNEITVISVGMRTRQFESEKIIVSFNSGRTQVGDETNYIPAAIHLRKKKSV